MSVTAAPGFVAAGAACGIKASGDADLALVATADGRPVTAAGVFTTNRMTAAPVEVSRAHLQASGGRAGAVILNSGNANAATGAPGEADAEAMCTETATRLGCEPTEVLVCSTGLIGYRLPIEPILGAVPDLVAAASPDGGGDAATAILTTDTTRKEGVVRVGDVVIGGMAKGAAMLRPDMATMLAVLTTDATVAAGPLREMLRAAVAASFNRLSVDGSTSTNDTVLVLAAGSAPPAPHEELAAGLERVCADLARQMADDAEGASKTVRVQVVGAASDADADIAARRIADSQLVKCSWYGRDPYWGRVASEAGSAGVVFDPTAISVRYGDVRVGSAGVSVPLDAAATAALGDYMAQRHLDVTVDLGVGAGRATILTNDLTHAYVDENMGTS